MDALRHRIHTTYKNAAEAVMSTRTSSAFYEKGVLTPEEFVEAGDYLVHVCPTWSCIGQQKHTWAHLERAWICYSLQAGDPRKARSFLPSDKQFLITRGVPCLRRAAAVEAYGASREVEVEPDEQGEGWLAAGVQDDADDLSRELEDGFEDVLDFTAQGTAKSNAAGTGGGAAAQAGGARGKGAVRAPLSDDEAEAEDIDSLEGSVGGDDGSVASGRAGNESARAGAASGTLGATAQAASARRAPATARSVTGAASAAENAAAADDDDDDDDVPDLSDLELDSDEEDDAAALGPGARAPAPWGEASSPPSRGASSTVTRLEGGVEERPAGRVGSALTRSEGSEASVFSGRGSAAAAAGSGAAGSASVPPRASGSAPSPSLPAPPASSSSSSILKTRTYDLLITYDKYYQVPRLWLLGYDEHRAPLPPQAVLDDVSQEHARKTVTIDPHPHGSDGVLAASIHPCKHANVLKRLSRTVARDGKPFQVQHALVLFLKFLAGVVPTIDYDYTMAAGDDR